MKVTTQNIVVSEITITEPFHIWLFDFQQLTTNTLAEYQLEYKDFIKFTKWLKDYMVTDFESEWSDQYEDFTTPAPKNIIKGYVDELVNVGLSLNTDIVKMVTE